VISTYWSSDAFALMLSLTSAMSLIPFFLVALYGVMIARRGETYDVRPDERTRDLGFAIVAAIYTLFLVWAGGLKFVLLSAILYAPGTILFIWARREQGELVFKPFEWLILAVVVIGAIMGIYGLATGGITI
jgi:arginine:ornithine antiporter/lysine permease